MHQKTIWPKCGKTKRNSEQNEGNYSEYEMYRKFVSKDISKRN